MICEALGDLKEIPNLDPSPPLSDPLTIRAAGLRSVSPETPSHEHHILRWDVPGQLNDHLAGTAAISKIEFAGCSGICATFYGSLHIKSAVPSANLCKVRDSKCCGAQIGA